MHTRMHTHIHTHTHTHTHTYMHTHFSGVALTMTLIDLYNHLTKTADKKKKNGL